MRRLLPCLLLLAGCDFYFGHGDDVCETSVDDGYGAVYLRNPSSGSCQEFVTDWPCNEGCPCGKPELDVPSWGACESSCTGLSEQACLETAGCQAAYAQDTCYQDAPSIAQFTGCWMVAPHSSLPDTSCWDRDAYTCAIDDSCAAYYGPNIQCGAGDAPAALQPPDAFLRCAPEPAANGCESADCGYGSHCELQCAPCADPSEMCPCAPTCVPDNNACAVVDCAPGYTCVETCGGSPPTMGGAMPPWECQAECVPETTTGDPGACTGDVYCFAPEPACPTGTVPGIASGCWTGYCIPVAACGPSDPGSCEPAVCNVPGPACPTGTVGGVANGCWTGYCIPASACPVAACELLATEGACSARSDCRPIYIGEDCTCDPGCTCEELTFDRCSSSPMPF